MNQCSAISGKKTTKKQNKTKGELNHLTSSTAMPEMDNVFCQINEWRQKRWDWNKNNNKQAAH